MSVSDSFRTFVLDQLRRTGAEIRSRAMFGGVGIYAADVFVALLDDDVLYFKVDDSNRERFLHRGMEPFRPTGEGGEEMQYYEVPADVLEDVDTLGPWLAASVAVARRAKHR